MNSVLYSVIQNNLFNYLECSVHVELAVLTLLNNNTKTCIPSIRTVWSSYKFKKCQPYRPKHA